MVWLVIVGVWVVNLGLVCLICVFFYFGCFDLDLRLQLRFGLGLGRRGLFLVVPLQSRSPHTTTFACFFDLITTLTLKISPKLFMELKKSGKGPLGFKSKHTLA